MNGYTGKILRVDLTTRKLSTLKTKDYEKWGGGHGIASAIFWDLCKKKNISGFDPGNVVTIMTSPVSGTITPSASSRTEVTGIGVQGYPIEWYTRSNFGGQFGAMLKFAGWDGITIEGKADQPVWLDIRNNTVVIRDAQDLWGKDTWDTQKAIRDKVEKNFSEWYEVGTAREAGRTTQKPAILTIGPAGENLSRIAALVHGAGSGAGQGGFGGVWGSKNLKAISVLGTGSVEIADAASLLDYRIEAKKEQYNVDKPLRSNSGGVGVAASGVPQAMINMNYKAPGYGGSGGFVTPLKEKSRPKGCIGCFENCRRNVESGRTNESSCSEVMLSYVENGDAEGQMDVTELLQRLGVNAFTFIEIITWLRRLVKMGVLGPGKQIDTQLNLNGAEFVKGLLTSVAYRKDIGAVLAEGPDRAAVKWGRQEDWETGVARFPNWGYGEHYEPRLEVEWSYGSILADRDVNDHSLTWNIHWIPTLALMLGKEPEAPAELVVKTVVQSLLPYKDPAMLDYSEKGIYGDGKVKMLAWIRRYNLFWKNSVLFCDWAWPDVFNFNTEDYKGLSPEYEAKFFNAVTGQNITFEQGMEIGQKIWNLDRSIYALQGRHRDLEVHAGYVYKTATSAPYMLPVEENGQWHYDTNIGRVLDKKKFEDWKTRYFTFEGWDPTTGWPTRKTLEGLGMKNVADELEAQGKLGK